MEKQIKTREAVTSHPRGWLLSRRQEITSFGLWRKWDAGEAWYGCKLMQPLGKHGIESPKETKKKLNLSYEPIIPPL